MNTKTLLGRRPARRFTGVAALAASTLVLAACGSGSSGAESTEAAASAAASPASAAAAAGDAGECTNLNVLFPQTHAGASEILKAGFETANPGLTITPTLIPYDELQQKATLDVQSGAGNFDVFDMWYVSVGALANDGVIAPLDDLVADPEVNAQDFIPSIYDAYSLVDGQRYALPFDGDTQVLFYNKEILDRNGVTPPTTWDEYAAAVKKITDAEKSNGVYGAALMAQKAPIIIASTYANRLAGFGGGFLDADGNPTLGTPEAIAAAQAMLDVAEASLPTPAETAFDQALGAFLGGKAANRKVVGSGTLRAFDCYDLELYFDLSALAPPKDATLEAAARPPRPVWFDGAWHGASVWSRLDLPEGALVHGPAILEQPDATVVVDPDLVARVDRFGNLIISRE